MIKTINVDIDSEDNVVSDTKISNNKSISPSIKTDLCKDSKNNLRPSSFDSYIGQKGIIDNLKVYVNACKKRNEPLDHVLLYGPAGLGKTSLAFVIAEEMGVNIRLASAPSIEKTGDIAGILNSLSEGDILFIDEIHRLPKVVEEVLYSAMEDFAIDILIGKDSQTKSIRLDLPKFTLIGATTRAGMISAPLRDRFGITEKLNFYTTEDLGKIVKRSADILDVSITKEACNIIGGRSRGTPRIANNLIKRCRDFATIDDSLTDNKCTITKSIVIDALDKLGVGEKGINDTDRLIIDTIKFKFDNGPVGLSTLASAIGEDEGTIENVYEPYLIFSGIIAKTPKGRVLTNIS